MKSSTSSAINFPELFKAYRKAWIWVIISVGIFGVLGLTKALKNVPEVPVTSQIMISGSGGSSSFSSMSEVASIMGMSTGKFGSNRGVHEEMLVLGSHTLLVDIARQLDLNTQYTLRTRFKKIPVHEKIPLIVNYDEAISDTLSTGISFDVRVNTHGKADIGIRIGGKDFRSDKDLTLPATVSLPYGDFTFSTTEFFKPGQKLRECVYVSSYSGAAIGLSQDVAISLATRKADIVELNYSTNDPKFGIRLLNAIMHSYRELTVKQQRDYLEYTLDFINSRISSLAKELNLAEGDIESFLAKRDLVSPEVQAEIFITESYTQEKELLAAENEHELLRLAIEFLNTETNNNSLLPIMPAIESLTPLIEGYNELILERITIEPSARGENVALKAINMRIDVVKDNLLTALNKHYEMAQVQIDELRKQFAQSKSKLETLPTVEREYVNIKRQQALQEQLYLFLLRQREETSLNIAGAQPLGTIIDEAYAVSAPFKPSNKIILLMYLIIGAAIPAVVILIRWKLNGKLNTLDQAIKETGLQPIAELPARTAHGLSVIDAPESLVAQRYRLMRSNILSLSSLKPGTVIAVCSASGSQSLSAEVAANLAASLCATGRRTLIVDADINKAAVASILQVQPSATLSGDIADATGRTQTVTLRGVATQLDAILSDTNSGLITSDILSSEAYPALIASLRPDYDFIVIALPSADDFGALEAGAAPADIVIADFTLGHTRTAGARKIARLAGDSRSVFFAAVTSK
ncbi:MAG: hypothetical protein K2I64_00055 [Muribaculaceae bacterium]|nr:hypothetical protein [Muribaculaceae bacterium]